MTHLFQPLDLTMKGYLKNHMKNKLLEWYRKKILKQREEGIRPEKVEVNLKLLALECQHQKVKKLCVMTGCLLVFGNKIK